MNRPGRQSRALSPPFSPQIESSLEQIVQEGPRSPTSPSSPDHLPVVASRVRELTGGFFLAPRQPSSPGRSSWGVSVVLPDQRERRSEMVLRPPLQKGEVKALACMVEVTERVGAYCDKVDQMKKREGGHVAYGAEADATKGQLNFVRVAVEKMAKAVLTGYSDVFWHTNAAQVALLGTGDAEAQRLVDCQDVREFFGTDAEYPETVFAAYEGHLQEEFREQYDRLLAAGC